MDMIKLLIYDLDGTLIDSTQDIGNSVNWTLNQLGFRKLPVKQIASFIGKGVRNLMTMSLKEGSPDGCGPREKFLRRAIKLYRARYAKHLLDETKLFDSVREVLEHFEDRKQAILTNKPEDFSGQILRGLGIDSYFFRLIGENQAFPKKPFPKSVLDIMKSARALPHQTVVIGDSEIDIQTGKNAGVKTIAVTYGLSDRSELERARPDYILNRPSELITCPLLA